MTKLITLARFYDLNEAQIVSGILNQHGIPATLGEAFHVGVAWHYLHPVGGVRVQVPEADEKDAIDLIRPPSVEVDHEDVTTNCPSCGASDIFRYSSKIGAAIGLIVGFIGFAATAIPLLLPTNRRRCRRCGHSWKI